MVRIFAAAALAALAALVTSHALAQAFPTRPITLIVPFPPGGSTDTAARILGEAMRAPLGQPVIIENVGGAGGSIGVQRVARAAPDGYTIASASGTRTSAPSSIPSPSTCRRTSRRSGCFRSIRSSSSRARAFRPTTSGGSWRG